MFKNKQYYYYNLYTMEQRVEYKERIEALKAVFNISEPAAKYIYHRRRRGYPYKNGTDISFMPWTAKLQNALMAADKIPEFDWNALVFSEEEEILKQNGIVVDECPTRIQLNRGSRIKTALHNIPIADPLTAWQTVKSPKAKLINKHIVRKMGFLPSTNF